MFPPETTSYFLDNFVENIRLARSGCKGAVYLDKTILRG